MTEALSKKITWANIIASVSILILHAYDVPSYSGLDFGYGLMAFIEKWLSISLFGHTSVNVFFLISGYLFAQNVDSVKTCIKKIKKRFRSLIIPYIFWASFGFILLFICSHIPIVSNTMNMKVDISITTIKSVFVDLEYNHPLWYVQNLMFYFVVSPILFFISRNKKLACLFLLFCVAAVTMGAEIPIFMLMRFTAYTIGYICGSCFIRQFAYNNKNLAYVAGSVLLLMSIGITILSVPKWIANICYILFPLLAWYSLFSKPFFSERSIKYLKGKTFWIYCGHGPILECFKQVFSIVANILAGSTIIKTGIMALSYILSPLLTAIALCIFLAIVEKLSPKIANMLTGGRNSMNLR